MHVRARAGFVLALAGLGLTACPAYVVSGMAGAQGTETYASRVAEQDARLLCDGQLCDAIPGGTTQPWDVIIGYDGVPIVSGEDYTLSFRASASAPATIRALVQRNADPWPTVVDEHPALEATMTEFAYSNTANFDEPSAQVAFQVGGSATPYTLCLDDIALKTGASAPGYEPDTGPRVKVNQVGYLPQGPKNATLVSEATDIFGTASYMDRVRTIAKHGTSAHRQIETHEKTGDIKSVVDWLMSETMRGIG
jgi:hypothetical protein